MPRAQLSTGILQAPQDGGGFESEEGTQRAVYHGRGLNATAGHGAHSRTMGGVLPHLAVHEIGQARFKH